MIPIVLASILLALTAFAPVTKPELRLPELHKIKTTTLSPSYSCQSSQDFKGGYAKTALFLSEYSEKRDFPDLLFNGACGSRDYFIGSTAGDDMSLIADLGTEPLEDVTTSRVFNLKRIHSFDLYSKFADSIPVEANHTYALLIDKQDVRGLVVFTVTGYEPNKRVDLRYAVKEYQLLQVASQSQGFDWEAKNQTDCACK